MDTKAILHNLRTKGLRKTLNIARDRREQPAGPDPRVVQAELFLAMMDTGIAQLDSAENKAERKKLSALLKAQEEAFTAKEPAAAKI